jgi:hypothetical protein
MQHLPTRGLAHLALAVWLAAVTCAPDLALAQASPFMTGASSLQTNILAWLTPVAIILVMVLGGMAMANRTGLIPDIRNLLEPCRGEIRWKGGDAQRNP